MSFRKPKEFKPTPAMRLAAHNRAKIGDDAPDYKIAEQTGVDPATYSTWKQIEGFKEWFTQQIEFLRMDRHEQLEFVAMQNITDFKFWEALAKRYGYIKENQPNGEIPMPVSMTFEQMKELILSIRKETA